MNKQQLLDIYTKEQRIEANHPGWERIVTEHTVRNVSMFGEKGFVIYSNLNKENVHAIIDQEIQYFKSISQGFEWKCYDYDQPDNIKDILIEKGFTVEDPEALLVLDIESKKDLLAMNISPEIVRITDDKGIDGIVSLEDAIWNESHAELGERLKRDLKDDPENLLIYAAIIDGKVVSGAWMYLHEGTSFGSLWGGSTLPEYRGRGIYTSLIAIRAQYALKKGYKLLTVDASPMSAPILQKRGFELLAYSYPCNSPE
ncbi:GNAT family N-acetyltransferase [Bacillus suaedaesalsae]|uniref:GNAT family N-acetyltransferase n=1 Tax=Bacillus suaedaesalsae TaxID=2810349 RepID=A0ABS2DHM6_9BACI|nr:GNAT family N-acetyltransferase [Bacillus suaedaesalsae]MBM6617989.1 GNAT family N-acetyltransferase [Bacillus suaedaesalsae]